MEKVAVVKVAEVAGFENLIKKTWTLKNSRLQRLLRLQGLQGLKT